MYSYYIKESILFSGTSEALPILPFTFKVMFHDCVESINMRNLNVFHWIPKQKYEL